MTDNLNPALTDYVAEMNTRDNEALIRRFTPDAVVADEGRAHRGTEEIRQWLTETQAAFEFTLELLRAEQREGEIILTCRTTGTFPGSPVDLRHFITLEGDRIAALTIRV